MCCFGLGANMLRPSFAETRDLHLEKPSGMKTHENTANSDGNQPIEHLRAVIFSSCGLGNLIPKWQKFMHFHWNSTCRYTRNNANPRHSM